MNSGTVAGWNTIQQGQRRNFSYTQPRAHTQNIEKLDTKDAK